MNKKQTNVVNRIRKLLALSESPYEAEAASALAKANALLSKQGLALSDVLVSGPEVVELRLTSVPRVSPWEVKLLKCILSATYTQALRVYEEKEQVLRIVARGKRHNSANTL